MSDQYEQHEPEGTPGAQHQSMVDPTLGHDAWQMDVTTRLGRQEARLQEVVTLLQQIANLLQQRAGGA